MSKTTLAMGWRHESSEGEQTIWISCDLPTRESIAHEHYSAMPADIHVGADGGSNWSKAPSRDPRPSLTSMLMESSRAQGWRLRRAGGVTRVNLGSCRSESLTNAIMMILRR